jgi:hypothetical protein
MIHNYVILVSLLAEPVCAAEVREPADLVVVNGKVLTVDERFTTAEAVAIRGGSFVFVGSTADAKKLIGDATRVIDAKWKSVVPGLIDTHVHAIGVAQGEAVDPFRQLSSIAEIQAWVRQKVAMTPEGQWIRTPRCDLTRLRERRLPTRQELDAATETRPVVFDWSFTGVQIQIVNTVALKAARIDRDTPPPPGGEIVKDAGGEPTGEFRSSRGLFAKYFPSRPVPEGEVLEWLERVHHRYNEVGITSVFERRIGVEGYNLYEKLKKEGRLTVRATVTIGLDSDGTLEGTESVIRALPFKFGDGDDWVRVGPLKIGVDGGILYGTAYMKEPYGPQAAGLYGIKDPAYRGSLSYTADKIRNMIRAGHRLGWQMCSHVTGDGGVDIVLDAVEAAHRDSSIRDRRYTLIHAYFPNAGAIHRAAALGVCVDTQPAWYYKDADAVVTALGEERMRSFIGLADWLRAGVKVAINTDHMEGLDPDKALNPFNPFLTMYVAVTRKTEGGNVIGPGERVSREDALRMMTTNAAYLSFDEKKKGSIEVGKLGDLVILSDELMSCEANRIKDIQVLATVVGGNVVYEHK